MPSRILRDSILSSPSLANCSPWAQDRFPRYLLAADDFGCFDAAPMLLRARLYPLREDVSSQQIAADLGEYEREGMLERWQENGRQYAFFVTWGRHQRVREAPADRPKVKDGKKIFVSRRKTPFPPSLRTHGTMTAYYAANADRAFADVARQCPRLPGNSGQLPATAEPKGEAKEEGPGDDPGLAGCPATAERCPPQSQSQSQSQSQDEEDLSTNADALTNDPAVTAGSQAGPAAVASEGAGGKKALTEAIVTQRGSQEKAGEQPKNGIARELLLRLMPALGFADELDRRAPQLVAKMARFSAEDVRNGVEAFLERNWRPGTKGIDYVVAMVRNRAKPTAQNAGEATAVRNGAAVLHISENAKAGHQLPGRKFLT